MPRPQRPYVVQRRSKSKSFLLTINPSSGLPERVCSLWERKSYQNFPQELAVYSMPKTKSAAESGALALISYLKKYSEVASTMRVPTEDVTVGAWIEKFTAIKTSPRTTVNASKNRPYSESTIEAYKSHYDCHIKNDPIASLKMLEIEEEDVLEYIARLSVKKKSDGESMGGTRIFSAVIAFMRITFNSYQSKARGWINPFQYIEKQRYYKKTRDALEEDEVIKLFAPGVLHDAMEVAVCAAMFLAGMRRAEIFALRAEDLDWHTPKITIRHAWQNFGLRKRKLGPPKGKRERIVPFDTVLQDAIKKLWAENGQHEFVFSFADGSTPGPDWSRKRLKKWLARAGIELQGRNIVPHGARHSLASILEDRNVPLRHIQEFLGHCDLKTTKGYLHSTDRTIKNIGSKISEFRESPENQLPFIQKSG
jgi:integrase